jgi:hypothetical protein
VACTSSCPRGSPCPQLTQVFLNDGEDVSQADYQLHLPEGATVTSFGFWRGERFLEASLQEKQQAEAARAKAAPRPC